MKKSIAGTLGTLLTVGLFPVHSIAEHGYLPIFGHPFSYSLKEADSRRYSHSEIERKIIREGLEFMRHDVFNGEELVDRVAVVKADPQHNRFKVFLGYENNPYLDIEEWQEVTKADVIFNSAQYMADPLGYPCALTLSDGKIEGPLRNQQVRGMLVAEPRDSLNLPLADLLDFKYDNFDYGNTSYIEGVQHWPVLLDREGKIRVSKTDWQANRTVVAKDFDGDILVFVTEGGHFTLYNFARFLRENKFNIHTAMNLDGGYEAEMAVNSSEFKYVTYGQFETYGIKNDASVLGAKIGLPNVIGIFPRD